jgi:hypothetical protein
LLEEGAEATGKNLYEMNLPALVIQSNLVLCKSSGLLHSPLLELGHMLGIHTAGTCHFELSLDVLSVFPLFDAVFNL